MGKVLDVKVCVVNCPDKPLKTGYLVVRVVDLVFWYYGLYDTPDRAAEVAAELENAIVFGYIGEEEKSHDSESDI